MIKNILLKFELSGKGIVNYDDSSVQKPQINKHENLKHLIPTYKDKYQKTVEANNVSLAKKHLFYNDDLEVDYKIKISENSLRHAIFNEDVHAQSSSMVSVPSVFYSYIGSILGLTRGYAFMNDKETLKKKSPLTITDAIQTNNTKSIVEIQTKSGEKDQNGDTKDNTMFFKETIGDITYEANGNIDLMELQFISSDPIFDRKAFNDDNNIFYENVLSATLPNFNESVNYYKIKNSVQNIPERGILLNNDDRVFLVKEVLKRLLKLNIYRKGGYVNLDVLKLKFVEDPINDRFNNEDGWVDIKTFDDVDQLEFNTENFYEVYDFKKAEELRNSIEKNNESKTKKKTSNKKSKKK